MNMTNDDRHAWIVALGLFAGDILLIAVAVHALPVTMIPGSPALLGAAAVMSVITAAVLAFVMATDVDPFPYATIYSGALAALCVEVWFREDPELFNGSALRGWPFFLFHNPRATRTMAPVPMRSYTRVFASWHAGGVCLCFFMHVLASEFGPTERSKTALALGLLWIVWASINSWRAVYGRNQFCQVGILFHSLAGPGCGLAGYWMLAYWWRSRSEHYDNKNQPLSTAEMILIKTMGFFCVAAVAWLATQPRKEAAPDNYYDDDVVMDHQAKHVGGRQEKKQEHDKEQNEGNSRSTTVTE